MTEYEITRAAGRCHVTGRALSEGEEFYTVLLETPQGFERRDYAIESWQGPPDGAVCHFRTRLPRREEPRKVFIDNEALINFFLRLGDSTEPGKLRFRFVLALILLRKRLLKYERTLREANGEYWEMRLLRDKSAHRIFNPALEDSEIEELTAQLGAVLAGFAPAAEDAFEVEAAAQAAEGQSP